MVHDRQPHACPAARLGGVSRWGTEPTGRNEGKPHRMSPDKSSPGVSRTATTSVKADDSLRRKPSAQGASGGVRVDSMSGSASREGWEVCGGEGTQPSGQAGKTGKPEVAVAEVGVLRSSEEAPVMGVERRRDAWSGRQGRWRLKAPQGDRSCDVRSPILTMATVVNAVVAPDSESRIRQIRSSGLMRGEVELRH